MDKLEQYLDQACRGIGGPRELRQHIRRELAEHLRDAMAEHKAAGLPEEQALAKALEDFGGSEQVRSELAATHGERLMGVMIDTAIEWKEKTMRAKWLWTSWTYLAAMGLVVLEVLSLCFCNVFLVPKLKKLQHDGWLYTEDLPVLARLSSVLRGLDWAGEYFTWLLLGAAALWGLFEWRVRSENKPFMRLAVLGTAGVALALLFFFTAAALIIPFEAGLPNSKITRPWAQETVAGVETAIAAMEQAQAKKDWVVVQAQSERAAQALGRLKAGPLLQSLTAPGESPTLQELRAHQTAAKVALFDALQATKDRDSDRLTAALKKFHAAFDPIAQAAKKPAAPPHG
ncbi:MAG: permease prefix domain 1-containing protein [Gemmataceae bacterium]